jgi:UDP-3-O-[3-hydroxymyristoyl] glucosamine N-acyltransferase
VGGVEVGDDVSIGPRCVVARATLGSTRIGSGSRIDAQVHIGHNVRIGRSCVLAAQVGIAGSAIVGDGVTIGGQAGVADHVSIGDGARVAARSGVAGNVDAGITVEGYPAMERWRWLRLVASLTRDAEE